MRKRTIPLAVIIAGLIAIAVIKIFEIPSRPFTGADVVILYFISLATSFGIALFFDPIARETTKKLYQINFYEEK